MVGKDAGFTETIPRCSIMRCSSSVTIATMPAVPPRGSSMTALAETTTVDVPASVGVVIATIVATDDADRRRDSPKQELERHAAEALKGNASDERELPRLQLGIGSVAPATGLGVLERRREQAGRLRLHRTAGMGNPDQSASSKVVSRSCG